jgi:hypothetical protein
VHLKKKGRAMPVKDSLIAASALQHQLTIVTRNVRDFQNSGVPLINLFESSALPGKGNGGEEKRCQHSFGRVDREDPKPSPDTQSPLSRTWLG